MKVYTKDLYEELYAGGMKVCKKNDAYAQFQLLVKELFAMGKNYEKVIFTCNASVCETAIIQKYGVATSHFQYVERYGAECSVEAGAVPCQLINFHDMEGYYRQGHKCIPADPCKKNNGGCSEYATCHSQIFGYEVNHHCKCHKGYYGDGFTCDPIDPCERNNCDANAHCLPYQNVLTEADYDCKCKKGYEGNGFICEKVVDPCEMSNIQCGGKANKKWRVG